jgi:glycine cleavage system transcriptional repressor
VGNSDGKEPTVKNKQLVISVMSKDRPGIIADITGVILNLGGDLADLTQSVLGGYFSMILIAEFDPEITAEDVFAGFSHIESDTKIESSIKEMDVALETENKNLPQETYIVTAQAKNRKGLVKVMGDFFYERNINVLDLETTRDSDYYTMIFQVDLSLIDSLKDLRNELRKLGKEEELNLVLQHNDIFQATHEISSSLDTTTLTTGNLGE